MRYRITKLHLAPTLSNFVALEFGLDNPKSADLYPYHYAVTPPSIWSLTRMTIGLNAQSIAQEWQMSHEP